MSIWLYQLRRQLRGIVLSQWVSSDATKTLVHAFITSRLDYCNSLLYGVAEQRLKRLLLLFLLLLNEYY